LVAAEARGHPLSPSGFRRAGTQIEDKTVYQILLHLSGHPGADPFFGQTDGELGRVLSQFVPRGARYLGDLLQRLFLDSPEAMLGFAAKAVSFGGHFGARGLAERVDLGLEILEAQLDSGFVRPQYPDQMIVS
jgi:hypothetical protein